MERPLCLDTREQMVASIMSKKLAAGSTHLLIDLPVGPSAKLANGAEAMRLRKLFEFVADRFGVSVEVITTDGSQPIGNGIGPVLEAEDVMAVLAGQRAGKLCSHCKPLRGAMASGKLVREVVNVQRGAQIVITSTDRATVQRIHEMTGAQVAARVRD